MAIDRIGRYELADVLGAGGFATVYRAFDPSLDSEVAIKVLAENWSANGEIRSRFIREAQLMRRLDDRRLVQIYDIGETPDGRPYFVMRLARRGTLADRLVALHDAGRSPDRSDIARLVDELTACLTCIHSERIVHRDVKPSNLLVEHGVGQPIASSCHLSGSESLILGDFGLARDNADAASVMTIAGGTGGYAAPEQLDPLGRPDERTDLYAATAVVHEAITGSRPALDGSPMPMPPEFADVEFSTALRRGLHTDPAERPATVADWASMMHGALRGEPTAPTVVTPPGPSVDSDSISSAGRTRTRLVAVASVALVIAIVVGVTAVLLLRNGSTVDVSGPDPVAAGTIAELEASHDDVVDFRWRLPDGREAEGVSIEYAAVIPGPTEVMVEALDSDGNVVAETAHMFTVSEAADGPRIVGPDRVVVGSEARYVVDGDPATVEWVDPGGSIEASSFVIEPTRPGSFTFSAVVQDGGRRIGTTKTIEIVEG